MQPRFLLVTFLFFLIVGCGRKVELVSPPANILKMFDSWLDTYHIFFASKKIIRLMVTRCPDFILPTMAMEPAARNFSPSL